MKNSALAFLLFQYHQNQRIHSQTAWLLIQYLWNLQLLSPSVFLWPPKKFMGKSYPHPSYTHRVFQTVTVSGDNMGSNPT